MRLCHKTIGATDKREYTYLGIPITTYGVAIDSYFYKIKNKIRAALHAIATYCNEKQINYRNRLLLYKSIIRSQIDYGIPVLNYNKKEIKRLQQLQDRALSRMTRMNPNTHSTTANAVHKIPSIRNRIHTMKLNFYMKLQKQKTNSMAHMVYKQLAGTH